MFRNTNWLGVLIVFGGLFASFGISTYYGWHLSSNPWEAGLFAGVGILGVLMEIAIWHRVTYLWSIGRRIAARVGFACALLGSTISVTYELGFFSTIQETSVNSHSDAIDDRMALIAERERRNKQIENAGDVMPVEAARADLDALEKSPLHKSTKECSVARSVEAKAHCDRFAKAQASFGAAIAFVSNTDRIREINRRLRSEGTTTTSDARASYIHMLTGASEPGIRVLLAALMILFLRACTAVSPWIYISVRDEAKLPKPDGHEEKGTSRAALGIEEAPALDIAAKAEDTSVLALALRAPDDVPFEAFDMETALSDMNEGRSGRPSLDPVSDLPELSDDKNSDPRRQILQFMSETLTVTQDVDTDSEVSSDIYNVYVIWCRLNHGQDIMSGSKFGIYLSDIIKELGCEKRKVKTVRRYYGMKMRPIWANRLANYYESIRENGEAGDNFRVSKRSLAPQSNEDLVQMRI